MGEDSKIEWCDHTFNGWIGCTNVSPACDNCYAEAYGRRFGVEWGNAPRWRTSETNWRQPLKWNRQAERDGVRWKVFCCSLADVFDNQVPEEWRTDLWDLIRKTGHLDWLLLTKRPQNIAKMLPPAGMPPWPWPHVWLGATVENPDAAVRIEHLLAVPAARRFLSCEPLLSDLNIRPYVGHVASDWISHGAPELTKPFPCIDWVIAGGESGTNARPAHPDWFRSLRDQCTATGVPFFFKQWGEWIDADQLLETIGSATISADYGVMSWQPRQPLNFTDAAVLAKHLGRRCLHNSDGSTMIRVGKKAAGALLDGREWRETPDG